MLENRAVQALRRPANWIQLAKFGAVGGERLRRQPRASTRSCSRASACTTWPRRPCSFVVAASWNYWWNRHWTFRERARALRLPGHALLRRLAASSTARTSACSSFLVSLGVGKIVAQAIAIVLVTPLELPREQALVVPALRTVAALALVAGGALAPAAPRRRRRRRSTYGFTVTAPPTHARPRRADAKPRLTGAEAERIFLAVPEGRELARALPAAARRPTRPIAGRHLDGRTSSPGRPARSRRARSTTRPAPCSTAWTGPAGRLGDGARRRRARSAARRSTRTRSGSASAPRS